MAEKNNGKSLKFCDGFPVNRSVKNDGEIRLFPPLCPGFVPCTGEREITGFPVSAFHAFRPAGGVRRWGRNDGISHRFFARPDWEGRILRGFVRCPVPRKRGTTACRAPLPKGPVKKWNLSGIKKFLSLNGGRKPRKTGLFRPYSRKNHRGREWHSRGQRFDPAYLHQQRKGLKLNVSSLFSFCQNKVLLIYASLGIL